MGPYHTYVSQLYYQQYVCVYDYYRRVFKLVFKLEDVLCIEGISGTLFDHDIQTTCARTVSALHAKKVLGCPQGKKIYRKNVPYVSLNKVLYHHDGNSEK